MPSQNRTFTSKQSPAVVGTIIVGTESKNPGSTEMGGIQRGVQVSFGRPMVLAQRPVDVERGASVGAGGGVG